MARGSGAAGLILEANFSRGMVRDLPRTSIPDGGCYDVADFLVYKPGVLFKRGGTSYAGPAMTAATYASQVAYAEFSAGAKLCAVGENGHLYTVTSGSTSDISTLGTGFPGKDKPKLRVGGGKELLVLCASNGTSAPKYYDGSSVSTFGGGVPEGMYCDVFKTRICLGRNASYPSRLWFSATPDPTGTWDTTNSWWDVPFPITGLAALQNVLVIFSEGHVTALAGTTPPPGSDFNQFIVADVGCTDARSITKFENRVIFASPGGIYMTNGAGVISLTREGLIETYWQSLFSGYASSSWTIATEVIYRRFLLVSVMNGSTFVASLICDLPTRSWARLTNMKAVMMAAAVGITDELYYAARNTNRVVSMSGIFAPASGNKNDADGTAVTPFLETRAMGHGTGVKHFGFTRISYDMRDASSDNPILAVATGASSSSEGFGTAGPGSAGVGEA